jgi:hypothetical protein
MGKELCQDVSEIDVTDVIVSVYPQAFDPIYLPLLSDQLVEID